MASWLAEIWHDIKGNAKWDFIKWVFGGGVIATAVALVRAASLYWRIQILIFVLCIVAFAAISMYQRARKRKLEDNSENLKTASPLPEAVNVTLVPWEGQGEKMYLTVRNQGQKQQAFQGQCRILARRNDPNPAQLIAYDLQWHYGGQAQTLMPWQYGNLLIASAGHDKDSELEWLQLEPAMGQPKPLRSHWNRGDKPPEYDVEITILGSDSSEPHSERFTVRSGTHCALEMVPLASATSAATKEDHHRQQSETLATLPIYPDDLRVELQAFCRGTTFDFSETTFFLKLSLVSDQDTGIREMEITCTSGEHIYRGKPMNDLSEWIIRTHFSDPKYPYKTFEEIALETISLWKELQQTGLKSGLIKVGWVGFHITEQIPVQHAVSKVRVEFTKPQRRNRELYRFTFRQWPECEHPPFDRAFRQH
jgi:hypothetical protein